MHTPKCKALGGISSVKCGIVVSAGLESKRLGVYHLCGMNVIYMNSRLYSFIHSVGREDGMI